MNNRVLRGGGWSIEPVYLRVVNRLSIDPGYRDDDVGFRCVCRPKASRVVRGGSWLYKPDCLRMAFDPGSRLVNIGLRCVGRGND